MCYTQLSLLTGDLQFAVAIDTRLLYKIAVISLIATKTNSLIAVVVVVIVAIVVVGDVSISYN